MLGKTGNVDCGQLDLNQWPVRPVELFNWWLELAQQLQNMWRAIGPVPMLSPEYDKHRLLKDTKTEVPAELM